MYAKLRGFDHADHASEMARYMKTVKGKSVEGHSKAMYSWNEKVHGKTHKRCKHTDEGISIHGKDG